LVLEGYLLPFDIANDRLITVKRPRRPESFQEIYDIFSLNKKLKEFKVDLFHSMVPGTIVPTRNLDIVVTVHDIIPEIIPEENNGTFISKFLYRFKMGKVKQANHIIADSTATRKDLSKHYNIPEEQITTVYLGSQFVVQDFNEIKKSSFSIHSRPYILYLGGFNFRKNVNSIIKAFSAIAEEFPEVDLLMGGKPSPGQKEELLALCSALNLNDRVIWHGFIKDEDLPQTYAWSLGFIYPSLYEGFGIPVLEAMQCGVPVITSNCGSIPEIIGEAGLIIDPYSIESMSDAIKRIIQDETLRETLKQKGAIQAEKFSWSICALDTLKVYHQILDK
jgi:glycosyltransferase involved in cell wall biosynthesis